jgi:hypothetical protein
MTRNAAGRDGDLTGFIRPKISGQYGALRLGPGRSPGTVSSTVRVGISTRGANDLAPVAQTEEAAGPNPALCTFESCRGYLAGDARVAERPLRTWDSESSTLSTGSFLISGLDQFEWWKGRCHRREGWSPVRTRSSMRHPDLAHSLVVTVSIETGCEHDAEPDKPEPHLMGQ